MANLNHKSGGAAYAQTVTVAKTGGDFSLVSSALASISDNATGKRYLIKVYPGTYTDAFTVKPYVDIEGSGENNTIITQADANVVTCTGISNWKISNLQINLSAPSSKSCVYGSGTISDATIENAKITFGGTTDSYGLYISSALTDVKINCVEIKGPSNSYGFGIYLGQGGTESNSRVSVTNCKIKSIKMGIYIYQGLAAAGSEMVEIKDNLVDAGTTCLYVRAGSSTYGGAVSYNNTYTTGTITIDAFTGRSTTVYSRNDTMVSVTKAAAGGVETFIADGTALLTAAPRRQYSQTITVAKDGTGNYETITSAIAAIGDATTTKRYCILLYPGTYTESFTLTEFVDLVGIDRYSCIVTQPDADIITCPSNNRVENITVKLTATSTARTCILIGKAATSSNVFIEDCDIEIQGSNNSWCLYMNQGQAYSGIFIRGCRFTSATTGNGYAISIHNSHKGAYVWIENCHIGETGATPNYGLRFLQDAAGTGVWYIKNNIWAASWSVYLNTGSANLTTYFSGNTGNALATGISSGTLNIYSYNDSWSSYAAGESGDVVTFSNSYNGTHRLDTLDARSNSRIVAGMVADKLTAGKLVCPIASGSVVAAQTEVDFSGNGNTATYSGTVAGNFEYKGRVGVLQVGSSNSSKYLTLADSDTLSFGDSSNDVAMSVGAWVNVQNRTGIREIFSKWSAATGAEAREYSFSIDATEKPQLICYDESVDKQCSRLADAGVSAGWHFIVITKDATGGATAMANTKIYVDGAVVASTASEDASYVAMENTATIPRIGASYGTAALQNYIQDTLGLVFATAEELSAGDVWKLYASTRAFYAA